MLAIIKQVYFEASELQTEILTQGHFKQKFGDNLSAIDRTIKESVNKYKAKLHVIKLKKNRCPPSLLVQKDHHKILGLGIQDGEADIQDQACLGNAALKKKK